MTTHPTVHSHADLLVNAELLVRTTDTVLAFEVPGIPRMQGSKTIRTRGDKAWLQEANPDLQTWRDAVIVYARQARAQSRLKSAIGGPVYVRALFVMPRPLDHYVGRDRERGWLRERAPRWHDAQQNDTDKLQRAIGDALTKARVLKDDGLIAMWQAGKVWRNPGEQVGVSIRMDLLC